MAGGLATLKGILNKGMQKTGAAAKAFGQKAYRHAKVLTDPKSYRQGGVFSPIDIEHVTVGKQMSGAPLVEKQISHNINKRLSVRAAKKGAVGTLNTIDVLGKMGGGAAKGLRGVGHVGLAMARSGPGKSVLRGGFALGATSVFGLSVMKGGMNEAKEIIHERYMQDYTFSRSMLHNSRVGLASGTNRMLDRGGTQGLSLGLSKTRHGRY